MRHVAGGVVSWRKFLIGVSVLLFVAGCYNAPQKSAHLSGSTVVATRGTERDSYVYYRAYEAYYNATRRQYVYREGRSWVNRPDLPKAWAKNLATTPQVPVEFHDAPEKHHAQIAREYPRDWRAESSKVTATDATH